MIVYFKRLTDLYTLEGARSAFEMLCNDLLILEDPKTKPMRANPGDRGIDAYLRLADGRYHVYQAKYFTEKLGDDQKKQIRESFASGQEYLGDDLVAWTLLLAKDLDVAEAEWLDKFTKKRAPVDIDWWGEAKLRGYLDRHPHVQEKYFNTGVEPILRAIVEHQGTLLSTLRTALIDDVPRPRVRLQFLRPEGLSKTLDVPESDFASTVPDVILVDEVQVASLVKNWSGRVSEKRVRTICSVYNQKTERYLEAYDEAELARYSLLHSTYVIFAVVNDGTGPTEEVRIQLSFPDSLLVTMDPKELSQRFEKIEEPTRPEILLRRIATKATSSRHMVGSMRAAPPVLNLLKIHQHIPATRRTAIKLDGQTATFWLKSVKHAGEFDHHTEGLYIAKPFAEDCAITFRLVVDNLPKAVEGELLVRSRDGVCLDEKWDPG